MIRSFIQTLLSIPIITILLTSAIPSGAKDYILMDEAPAALDLQGWENASFPLGNGYMGVSFFGGVEKELWQVTDPTIYANSWEKRRKRHRIGLSSAVELYFETEHEHESVSDYSRQLDIMRGLGTTTYVADGVTFTREQLTSYPANVFSARISADKNGMVSFRLRARHSYPEPRRTVQADIEGDVIVLTGMTEVLKTKYQARIAVEVDEGDIKVSQSGNEGIVEVTGANAATVCLTIGTNYQNKPEVYLTSTHFYGYSDSAATPPEFEDKGKKLEGNPLPVEAIKERLTQARAKGWESIKQEHLADFQPIMERCSIDLGGVLPEIPIAEVRGNYKSDKIENPAHARYLEELFFQYGRYLMAASSRPGTLPAGLQGTWSWKESAPWTGGYWLNINFQMNYWPTFSTNLTEMIGPYLDQLQAMYPRHQYLAKLYAKDELGKEVDDVWTVGHSNHAYDAAEITSKGGIGGGPFTLLPLWDWYLFTGDTEILEEIWPLLYKSSRFLVQVMQEQEDGKILAVPSYSPENKSPEGVKVAKGTAYDQQMVYEGHLMTLTAARILGKDEPLLDTMRDHLPRLDPVMIGSDPLGAYLMEFREEKAYHGGSHRHISQLVGLVPGTIISQKPEWIQAAQTTLNLRGDKSRGWALAHRLNSWARTHDGDRSLVLLDNLLSDRVYDNLWGKHAPFQIDANFGGTSGIAEMLLQSHVLQDLPDEGPLGFEDFNFLIHILPAIPKEWSEGSFTGMKARGGFEVGANWESGKAKRVTVKSLKGNAARLQIGDQVQEIKIAKGEVGIFDF
ncbi:glycosyl hydrolase family 95 catalytic domain-containing protein [Haloferula sp. A504]|uniref:glycosyl hydrolase family 95 catalytic domain-containing protein n=1 Tax=Haloferula sp. A504 TaxID=3373601 RepID=UPI0031C805C3|nr:glycoside hydrolase family 95 protein [Verrucomicrobiaceae bacterium E54]